MDNEEVKVFLKTKKSDEEKMIFSFSSNGQVWHPAFLSQNLDGKFIDYDGNEMMEVEAVMTAVHNCIFCDIGYNMPAEVMTHVFEYYRGHGNAEELVWDFFKTYADPREFGPSYEDVYEKAVKSMLEKNESSMETVQKLIDGFKECNDIRDIEIVRAETVSHIEDLNLGKDFYLLSICDDWTYPEYNSPSFETMIDDYAWQMRQGVLDCYYIGSSDEKLLKEDSEIELREAIVKGIVQKDYWSAIEEYLEGIKSIDYWSNYIYDFTDKKPYPVVLDEEECLDSFR